MYREDYSWTVGPDWVPAEKASVRSSGSGAVSLHASVDAAVLGASSEPAPLLSAAPDDLMPVGLYPLPVSVRAAWATGSLSAGGHFFRSLGPFLSIPDGDLFALPMDVLESLNTTFRRCGMPGNNDNRADQMNPNNDAYWQSRGYDDRPYDWEDRLEDDDGGDDDNRANQLNPNNDAYRSSRVIPVRFRSKDGAALRTWPSGSMGEIS